MGPAEGVTSLQDEVLAAENAVRRMGGGVIEINPVDSFGPLGQRTVIVVQKISPTPPAYPRDNGLPKKNPL